MVLEQGVLKPRIVGKQISLGRKPSHTRQGLTVRGIQRLIQTGKPNICITRCLASDTRILLSNGLLKPISQIEIGDTVINRYGDPTQVLSKTCSGKPKSLVKFRSNRMIFPITCTPEHRVLVLDLRDQFDHNRRYGISYYAKQNQTKKLIRWIPASDLNEDTFLLTPSLVKLDTVAPETIDLASYLYAGAHSKVTNKSIITAGANKHKDTLQEIAQELGATYWQVAEVSCNRVKYTESIHKIIRKRLEQRDNYLTYTNRFLQVGYDLGKFFGIILGDGSKRIRVKDGYDSSGEISIAINSNDTEDITEICRIIKTLFGREASLYKSNKSDCVQAVFYSIPVARMLEDFGKRKTKQLPAQFLFNNKRYLQGLLDGLIQSDGTKETRVITNTSPFIVSLAYWLHSQLGSNPKIDTEANRMTVFQGKKIQAGRAFYVRPLKAKNQKLHQRITVDNITYDLSKLSEKEFLSNNKEEVVWDIGVDGTESFIAENIIVHNSLGGIGDVLMTTPTLRALKYQWPESRLTYATDFQYMDGALKDVLLYNPDIDELLPHQVAKSKDYDLQVDVTSVCIGAEKPNAVVANRIDMFAEHVGVSLKNTGFLPTYIISKEEKVWAKKKLDRYPRKRPNSVRIGIQARSSTASRSWELSKVRELAARLVNEIGAQVIVFDTSHGHGESESWNMTGIVGFKDYKIRQVAALINEMDLMITPDSGLMHIAGALNKKMVTIWAGTDPNARINHYPNAIAIARTHYSCQPCVTGDSYVLTDKGYKEIVDIVKGDLVKTATGLYKPVTKLHKNRLDDRQILQITPMGYTEPIKVTNDHKLLISKKDKVLDARPEWIKSEDIELQDYLCIPRNKKASSISDEPKDLFWLYGLYMAEGDIRYNESKRSYRVRFTLGSHEDKLIQKIEDIVSRRFRYHIHVQDKRPKEKTKIVAITRKAFVKKILELFGRNISKTKKVPSMVFGASDDQIQAFIDGYFAGDGYTYKNSKIYSTASQQIAYGIQELYSRLGQFAKVYKRTRDTNYNKNSVIYRVYVCGYNITNKSMQRLQWKRDDTYLYVPVKQIEILQSDINESVYDITVEDDPTFTINNLATYDCWYSPVACNKTYLCIKSITVEEVFDATLGLLNKDVNKESRIIPTESTIIEPIEPIELKDTPVPDEFDYHIVRDDGIGDIVACLPAFSAFRKAHPGKKIAFSTMAKNVDLMNLSGCFDNVVPLYDKWGKVNHTNPIDARDLFEKNAAKDDKGCYFESIPRPEAMAKFLGVEPDYTYKLPKDTQGIEEMKERLEKFGVDYKQDRLVTIQLAGTCTARSWIKDYYKPFIRLVKEMNLVPVILGRDADTTLNLYNCINFGGHLSVSEFNCIIDMSYAFVGVDSGGIHLAAANNVPFVAIFNAIPPDLRLSKYKNYRVIFPDNLKCAPCWDRGCNKMTCMKQTTPEVLASELKSLIEEI